MSTSSVDELLSSGEKVQPKKTAAKAPKPPKNNSRWLGWTVALLFTVLAGALFGFTAGASWQGKQTPTLVSSVTQAGFSDPVYYPSTRSTIASVTAKFGGCTLRFVKVSQELPNVGTVDRLGVIKRDGSVSPDPSPISLSSDPEFKACNSG